MIRLRQALIDCGISQQRLAEMLGYRHINSAHYGLTGRVLTPEFRARVERWLAGGSDDAAQVNAWIARAGADIWSDAAGLRHQRHNRMGAAIRAGLNISDPALIPGDPKTLKPHPTGAKN